LEEERGRPEVAKDENSWKESKPHGAPSFRCLRQSCEGREFLEGIKTPFWRFSGFYYKVVAKDENSWKESKPQGRNAQRSSRRGCEGREFLEGIKTMTRPFREVISRIVAKDENSWKESKLYQALLHLFQERVAKDENSWKESKRYARCPGFCLKLGCEGREFLEGIKTMRRDTDDLSRKAVAKDENSWKESKRGLGRGYDIARFWLRRTRIPGRNQNLRSIFTRVV